MKNTYYKVKITKHSDGSITINDRTFSKTECETFIETWKPENTGDVQLTKPACLHEFKNVSVTNFVETKCEKCGKVLFSVDEQ